MRKMFAGTYFCGSLEKSQKLRKLEPAKILCHTVFPVREEVVDEHFVRLFTTRNKK